MATTRTSTATGKKKPTPVKSSKGGMSAKARAEEADSKASSMVSSIYSEALGFVEKKYRLSGSGGNTITRYSSGSAVLDLVMAGGYVPGRWYTMLGKEASGKSTALMSTMEEALYMPVPLRLYFDYEGSLDFQYFGNMCRKPVSQQELFGLRDDAGKRIKRGKIEYYNEDVAETFFNSMGSLLRRLPDKIWVPEHKGWFLRFDVTKDTMKFKSEQFSKLSDAQNIWIPSPDGLPQGLIFLDSYPAMLPDRLDEDDAGSGMAAQARMFSEELKKVRPKLRRKHVSITGVNQIREKPAVMFGSPEYEPCGEALKFVSDCRVRFSACAVPKHCVGQGAFVDEKDVSGEGTDRYRYVKLATKKNKMGPNFMEGNIRIWMQDSEGQGHGIDPVFDTWQFLKLTGWMAGSMNKMVLTVPNTDKEVKMNWEVFKQMILCKGDDLKAAHRSLRLKEPLNLRRECRKLLASGDAVKHYFETAHSGSDD